jgi:osmotically-inducible protein OsmY
MESALMWNVVVPKAVTARVQDGWITLEGAVKSQYQRKAAEFSVRHLTGVVGVTNAISLIRPASSIEVKEKVEQALQRQASADAKSIRVEASGGKVTLSGHASSWRAIEDAANAAWAAPGVFEVDDQVKMAMAG